MDRMDILAFKEGISKDFKILTETFERNFNHLGLERLKMLRIKVSDLIDLLTIKVKLKY